MPTSKKQQTRSIAPGKIAIANVNVPGYTQVVDASMYQAMRKAVSKILPSRAPGLTQTDMRGAVLPHLPADLFPGGAKSDGSKLVQLDLEAKGVILREATNRFGGIE